jgi:hypothetical protein
MPRNHKLRLKRIARLSKIPLLLFCCIVFIPVIIALGRVGVECRPFSSGPSDQASGTAPAAVVDRGEQITAGLDGYVRSEDQTYLTLPEWYIVYSSDEYAAFIASNRPSNFPYFRAVGQFWQSYYDVCAVTRERYTFNSGYHLSLAVIGTSFTIENILKGIYENIFGRLTEWLSSPELTAEDVYARQVAAEYGTFLHTIPWYEFPFGAKLRGLWNETPFWGPNMIRKVERKGALSMEYGSKAVYAWLIRQGTQSVYSSEDLEIQVWAEGVSAEVLRDESQARIVKPIDDNAAIVSLPRYEAFTLLVPELTEQGMRMIEIAGNDEILITVIAPQSWEYDLDDGQFLFAMPILTEPDRRRVAVQVPVNALHRVLSDLDKPMITLEHIYDY